MSQLATNFVGCCVVALSLLIGSGAVANEILKPIRSTGDEVGLIFIPDMFLPADSYNETARAIQEASHLRVWVALTGDNNMGIVAGSSVKDSVAEAMKKLKDAGMKSENYVGVGHGWGGYVLQLYATDSDLKALILMGSTISRSKPLKDFPIPVLTLGAELDGITPITRIVEEYDKLTDDAISFFKGLYRTPVILVEGSNHAQFASGTSRTKLQAADLKPSVTDEEAREWIAKHVHNFLTVTFGSDIIQVDDALEELADAFLTSARKFQPFVDMREMDSDGEESMWTVIAQEIFSGEYEDRVGISNEIDDDSWFFGEEPRITKSGNSLILETFTTVDHQAKQDPLPTQTLTESPREVSMKLVSKNHLWQLLGSQNNTILRSEPNTCKEINQLALYLALGASGEAARDRYFRLGRPIVFEEDAKRGANFLWAPSPLQMWEDSAGLHVRAIAMETNRFHYCKVIPVYRAMEWVNINSLRSYPVAG